MYAAYRTADRQESRAQSTTTHALARMANRVSGR